MGFLEPVALFLIFRVCLLREKIRRVPVAMNIVRGGSIPKMNKKDKLTTLVSVLYSFIVTLPVLRLRELLLYTVYMGLKKNKLELKEINTESHRSQGINSEILLFSLKNRR